MESKLKISLKTTFLTLAVLFFGACTSTTVSKKSEPTDSSTLKQEAPVVSAQHVFSASPDRVWEILTSARYVQHWWGPLGFTATVKRHDFKKGGRFLWGMEGPGFPAQWNAGIFSEVTPKRRLVLKMAFAEANGKVVPAEKLGLPGRWPESTDVIFEISQMNGQTHVKVTQRGIPAEMSQPRAMAWVQQFDKMDSLIAAP